MTKDKALKMAIEAMTLPNNLSFLMAITACKEALEQPSVAELNDEYLRDTHVEGLSQPAQEPIYIIGEGWKCDKFPEEGTKLYTQPAPSWQGLSDEEIIEKCAPIWGAIINTRDREETVDFARAIEKALKEKNG